MFVEFELFNHQSHVHRYVWNDSEKVNWYSSLGWNYHFILLQVNNHRHSLINLHMLVVYILLKILQTNAQSKHKLHSASTTNILFRCTRFQGSTTIQSNRSVSPKFMIVQLEHSKPLVKKYIHFYAFIIWSCNNYTHSHTHISRQWRRIKLKQKQHQSGRVQKN